MTHQQLFKLARLGLWSIAQLLRVTPLLLISPLVIAPNLVWANGGTTLIMSQEQGPYRVDVSLSPGRAIVGTNHLSILIVTIENGDPVTSAAVNIFAVGPAGSTDIGPIPAPNDVSPQFFETNLPFDMQGGWVLTIEIIAEAGDETVTVPLIVRDGGRINLIMVAVVAVLAVTVSIWTWDRIKGIRAKAKAKG